MIEKIMIRLTLFVIAVSVWALVFLIRFFVRPAVIAVIIVFFIWASFEAVVFLITLLEKFQ